MSISSVSSSTSAATGSAGSSNLSTQIAQLLKKIQTVTKDITKEAQSSDDAKTKQAKTESLQQELEMLQAQLQMLQQQQAMKATKTSSSPSSLAATVAAEGPVSSTPLAEATDGVVGSNLDVLA